MLNRLLRIFVAHWPRAPLVLLQFPCLLAVIAEQTAWLLTLTVGFLSFLGQFQ